MKHIKKNYIQSWGVTSKTFNFLPNNFKADFQWLDLR